MYPSVAMGARRNMAACQIGSVHKVVYLEGRQNHLIVHDIIMEQDKFGDGRDKKYGCNMQSAAYIKSCFSKVDRAS